MVTWIWANIGSSNGLLPDSTRPLPESVLANHDKGSVAFSCKNFIEIAQDANLKIVFENNIFMFFSASPRG